MDETQRVLIGQLRGMGSTKAADWLIEHYPSATSGSGQAIHAVRHLSWLRADQVRLAAHYLQNLPHASDRAYRAFASFMQLFRLVKILSDNWPADQEGLALLEYHLAPVLRRSVRTQLDYAAVGDFLEELAARRAGRPARLLRARQGP